MESTFSALIKKRRSYFCRSNCYLSDGALWCLCPKLMLFVLQIKKGKRFCVERNCFPFFLRDAPGKVMPDLYARPAFKGG